MKLFKIGCSFPALLFLFLAPAHGYQSSSDTGETDLSPQAVQRQIRRLEADKKTDEGQQTAAIAEYKTALSSLDSAAGFKDEQAKFNREKTLAARRIRTLQRELANADAGEELKLPKNATATQIIQALSQARADLDARRHALSQLDQIAQRRVQRRQEIAVRTGVLNEEVYEIDEARSSQEDADTTLRRARDTRLLARRRAVLAEIAAMRAELSSYDAGAELIPLRRDRAQRRVADSTSRVDQLEQMNRDRTLAESEKYFADVRTQCARAKESHPFLAELAEEIQKYADLLAGSSGVRVLNEQVSRKLTSVQAHIAQLQSIFQLTKRKFEAVGMQGTASHWFPEIPQDFPEIPVLEGRIRSEALQIPDVEYQLIVLEESRKKLGDVQSEAEEFLKTLVVSGEEPDSETVALTKVLLNLRRELLDRLLPEYTRYSSHLRDVDKSSRDLLASLEEFRKYLAQRVLWVRSVQGPTFPSLSDAYDAFIWVVANPDWEENFSNSLQTLRERPLVVVGCLLLLVALLTARPWLGRRLLSAGDKAARDTNLSFWPTLDAALVTLLLALPLPLVLELGGRFFDGSAPTEVAAAVGRAFRSMALFSLVFEILIHSLRDGGLAEKHFGWTHNSTTRLRSTIRRWLPVMLFSAFVCLLFSQDIFAFVGTPEEVALSDSLGRIAFLAFSLTLAYMLYRILAPPALGAMLSREGRGRLWVRYILLPTLASLALLCTLLAALGFYLTAYLVTQRLVRTLLFVILLFLLKELVQRWRALRRQRQIVRLKALDAPSELALTEGAPIVSEKKIDLELADSQVQRSIRVGGTIIALVGIILIWSDLMPFFSILQRIEIWPEITLLTEEEFTALESSSSSPDTTVQEESSETTTGSSSAPAGLPGPIPGSAPQANSSTSFLSLSELLSSIAALVLTILISRALPGFLEFTLLQRLPLDSGDRYAIGTIAKYIVLFSGIAATAMTLGLTWSSVQWLAAAFSFGLAFGLQEIFANFVSGLIILFERPVRVGDAIEIGGLSGIVSKVRMRATTITTWNRSELVVPNKEFVTGKLINWTLSNRCARVEVPVCVKYGTNVQEVKDILLEVGRNHPETLENPRPFVIFDAFGERGLMFELRAYIDYSYGRLAAKDELHTAVEKAFAEREISFAFPQLDLHLAEGDDPAFPGPLPEGTKEKV